MADGAVREDMVENGVAFWKHERVKDTPFNERISFLRQKGLTQEEIDEVQRRVFAANAVPAGNVPLTRNEGGGYSVASPPPPMRTAMAPYQPPQVQYVALPPRTPGFFERLRDFLAPIASMGALGVAGTMLYRQYFGASPVDVSNWTPRTPNGMQFAPSPERPYGESAPYSPGRPESMARSAIGAGPNRSHDYPGNDTMRQSDAFEIESLRRDLKVMTENFESQSKQLRDAIETLNGVVQSQSIQNTNNTSLGLLMANSANASSAREMQIRKELGEIKALLARGVPALAGEELAETADDGAWPTDGDGTSGNGLGTTEADADNGAISSCEAKINDMKASIDQAFQFIVSENDEDVKKAAHGMLAMVLKNLKEQPTVPRYHRVKKDNPSFKKMVGPLKGYEEFLIALGFEHRGGYLEFTLIPKSFNEEGDDEEDEEDGANADEKIIYEAILHYGIKLVDELKEPKQGGDVAYAGVVSAGNDDEDEESDSAVPLD